MGERLGIVMVVVVVRRSWASEVEIGVYWVVENQGPLCTIYVFYEVLSL